MWPPTRTSTPLRAVLCCRRLEPAPRESGRDRCRLATSAPACSKARQRAGRLPWDEVTVLDELAGDPAPAAEMGAVNSLLAGMLAARADAPSLLAGLATGALVAAPACRSLADQGARLPEDVKVEEEAADLAAALACRGSPTSESIVSESRMQCTLSRRAAKK